MWRRIYCSFPEVKQAREVVAELCGAGVERSRIHTVATLGVDLSDLPIANEAERNDRVWFWDRAIWYGNLLVFGVALACGILALIAGSVTWMLVAVLIAVVSYRIGEHFAVRIPHFHLAGMRIPLGHGEIVLMIDVPRNCVHEIEQLVRRAHPEVDVGGVGWTIVSAGI